ncbi:NAD(P)H-binding protein [Nonomuraea muscovyensis]|uniref:NAD(P)-dependent oxidoreductase n=1 Tax=Nonomuraea muscovyensis TaxID=1124761 RepID=UPI0034028330
MSKIVIFGAGGRAGRHVVAEAVARGHHVTAVVRDPAKHRELLRPHPATEGDPAECGSLRVDGERGGGRAMPGVGGVRLIAGDVTDAGSVAAAAAGHDAVISVAARLDVPSVDFYVAAAHALLDGLARAGVGRLVLAGIGTTLEAAPGVMVHDTPGFPPEARAFSLGHAAELEVLRDADTGVDWLVLAPPPVFLDDAPRTGRYRIGGGQVLPSSGDTPFPYADLAVALIDEVETPAHHRTLAAVAGP